MKNFAMGEQRRLQLRLEAYNATNTPHFANPNVQFGGTSFGIISSASDAGRFDVLLASTLIMATIVVLINRLLWRRLYRLASSRFKLQT